MSSAQKQQRRRKRSQQGITGPEPSPSINVFDEPLSRWWLHEKVMIELPTYYNVFAILGQGAYGCVIAASVNISPTDTEVVAVKKYFDPFAHLVHAKRTVRELRFLRCLQHENVIGIRTIFCSGKKEDIGDIYLATEVMDTDLYSVICSPQPFGKSHAKFFVYQLLRGLKYIHSAGVIHRDLKPTNLLVNKNCDLKICDFGMARLAQGFDSMDAQMTEYVCTRWYRAPEVLCCWAAYTTKVDIWSCGCILAEMLNRQCLFKGKGTIDQLWRIQCIIGTPTAEEIDAIPNSRARCYLNSQPKLPARDLAEHFGQDVAPDSLDMLGKMLQFDPDKRQNCKELLEHPHLEELHDEVDEPISEALPSDAFEFERREVTMYDLKMEIYDDVLKFHPKGIGSFEAYGGVKDRPPVDNSLPAEASVFDKGEEQEGPEDVDDDELVADMPCMNRDSEDVPILEAEMKPPSPGAKK